MIKKCTRQALIILVNSNIIGFVLKKDENYYAQMFLKEWKYTEKKVSRHITVDL